MLIPAAVGFAWFFVYPAVNSVIMSFYKSDLFRNESQFIGWANFNSILTDPVFLKSLMNTVTYVFASGVPLIVLSLLFAILIERCAAGRTVFRSLIYIPCIISMTIAGMMWRLLFNPSIGYVNILLETLGIPGLPWLAVPNLSMIAVIIVGIWRGLGTNTVLFIAGLKSVSRDQLEAARVDGAKWHNEIFSIMLPALGHVTLFIVISTLISSFQVFTLIKVMTEGGPNNATNMLVYHLWQEAFRFFDIGRASVISTILFLLLLFLSIIMIRVMDKGVSTYE